MAPEADLLLNLENWSLVRRHQGREIVLLDGIDLKLRTGRWLAVLGANGSGKSSLLKYLASDESPLAVPTAIMFQDPDEQIIASTVRRELTLGREDLQSEPVLAEHGLAELADLDPRLLSAGQKQRLVLAVAQAGKPSLLLADEPTALQDPAQARWILERLKHWVRQPGHTLVTATCDRREAALADELLVLEQGRVLLQGPAKDLLDDQRVVRLLGEAPASASPIPWTNGTVQGAPLEARNLVFNFQGPWRRLSITELVVPPGARLGITGGNGCGKSTLLASFCGARPPQQGHLQLGPHRLYQTGSLDLDHGRAMLAPQFPEYLFTRGAVADEIALDGALASQPAATLLGRLGLAADLAGRNPHSLSSGQRRRLALGLVLFSGRPLLLLDEPTAGLDRLGRRQVLDILHHLPAQAALIMASHDRHFLAAAGCAVLDLEDFAHRT